MKDLFKLIILATYVAGAALAVFVVYGVRDESLDDPETQAESWE